VRPAERWRPPLFAFAAAAALGAAAALAVLVSGRPPDGPVAVDWDGVRCAHCGMLVSDPSFAAQRHDEDGSVSFYDDPGCLLADLEENGDDTLHAAWLHHLREDRWIALDEARFVRVARSPMGYGLGVVDRDEPGEVLDLAAARRVVAQRARAAEPGRPTR